MSSNTATPKSTIETSGDSADSTLQRRIDETRRLLRQVDLSQAVIALLTLLFGFLLLLVLTDHWLMKDGLSTGMRIGFFVAFLAALLFFVYRRIVPLFLYPINPVYAADILERHSPSVKNALVNWILLREERLRQGSKSIRSNSLSERMLDGVTRTAVRSAVEIPSEQAVDMRGIAQWGSALILLLLVFTVYAVFSPKNPLTSIARIVLPLSRIEPPQAVRFLEPRPGTTSVLQGERLDVSVKVVSRGRAAQEPVYLLFSTDDGQAIGQAIPMTFSDSEQRFQALLPPGKQGFVDGVDYWFQQGESRSERFRIDVQPVASLEIVSLVYRYPDYTGRPEETVENGGNIQAVEGTDVQITVRSSQPLDQSWIVFNNDLKQSSAMKFPDGERIRTQTTVTLHRDEKDDDRSTVRNFSFRGIDRNGHESRRSGVFRLEILPDYPPMVQWSETDERLRNLDQIDIPLNGSMDIPIQAEDPDFGLRALRFCVESGNKRIRPVELLQSPSNGPTEHTGIVQRTTVFSPATSRLNVGDSAEIWAEAVDTRLPEPNISLTRRIKVRVVDPEKRDSSEKQEKKPEEADKGQTEMNDRPNRDDRNTNDSSAEKQNQSSGGKQGTQSESDNEAAHRDSEEPASSTGESNENTRSRETPQEESGDPSNHKQGDEEQRNRQQSDNDSSEPERLDNRQDEQEGRQDSPENRGESKENPEPVDPETNPGDAIEKIMEQMKNEGKFPPENQENDSESGSNNDDRQNRDQERNENKDNNQSSREKEENEQRRQDSRQQDDGAGGRNQEGMKAGGNPEDAGTERDTEDSGGGQGGPEQDSQQPNSDNSGQGDSKGSTESDREDGDSGGKQDTEKNDGRRQRDTSDSGLEDDQNDDQGAGGGEDRSPGKKADRQETSGGDQQGDPHSPPTTREGDNRKSDKKDIPVDPNDTASRERADLDPDKDERRNQSGNLREEGESNKDAAQNTLTTGDEGRGEESNDSGRSERAQTSKDGKRGDQGTEGVEQKGGSKGEGETERGGGGESDASRSDGESSPEGTGEERTESEAPGDSTQDEQSGAGQQSSKPSDGAKSNGSNDGGDAAGRQPEDDRSSLPSQSNDSNSTGSRPMDEQADGDRSGPPMEGTGGGSAWNTETNVEDVNREYAEKVTNLVLEYLEDQLKDKPSQELLDKLGWTEDQLRRYHRKWKEMAEAGRANRLEPADGNESMPKSDAWEEFLKSLGIRPGRENQTLQDARTKFKDAGSATESRRYEPPSRLRSRYERYTKGIGR